MENKAEKEMNWKRSHDSDDRRLFLRSYLNAVGEWCFQMGKLEKTQKVFAEISKSLAAATIPSSPPDSAVGMETDSGQETAGVNPDAIDSVPCCGAPTELPPVEMVDEPVPNNSENVDKDPVTFEEAFDNEMEQVIVQMPEESRAQMRNFFAKINAFEATLGESDLAELDRMKEGIRAQFKAQEAMFMPEGAESELAEEEQETREKGREKNGSFSRCFYIHGAKEESRC